MRRCVQIERDPKLPDVAFALRVQSRELRPAPGQRSAATDALGNRNANPNPSLLGLPCRRVGGTAVQAEREIFILAPFPRAALRLPWATLSSSLRDFGLAH